MKNPDIENLIEKSRKSLEAAKLLFEEGYYEFAVSRAYYAMFYCAEAVLLTKEMSFSRHSAVISAFGKIFIKTGILPQSLHSFLLDAFKARQLGDYDILSTISQEEAEDHLKNAEKFV